MIDDKVKTRVKIVIYLTSSIMMISIIASAIIAQVAKEYPQAPIELIQMILTAPALVSLFFSLIAGALTKRFSKKSLIVFALINSVFGGMISLFFGLVSIYILLIGSMFIGIGIGMVNTLSSALIADTFDGDECRHMLGLQSAFVNFGSMFYVFFAGLLANIYWNMSYLIYIALIPIIIAVIILLPKQSTRSNTIANENHKPKAKLNPRVFFFCATIFFYGMLMYVYMINVSEFLVQKGFDNATIAASANTIYTLSGGVFGLLFGRINKKLGKFSQFFALILVSFGFACVYIFGNLASVIIAAFCTGGMMSIMMPFSIFSVVNAVDSHSSDIAVAFICSSSSLGMFLSGIVLKPIADSLGGGISTLFLIGSTGLAMLALINIIDATFIQKKKR